MSYDLYSRRADWPVRVGVKVIETVTDPVIPLDVCRQHLELVPIDGDSDSESHPDDAMILAFLGAAVDYAEDRTGLCIVERVLEMALDTFPQNDGAIQVLRPPVIEILSFTGADGSDNEMDPGDDYVFDDYRNPPVLVPVTSWPSVTAATNLIKIRYRAGYARETAAEDVSSDALDSASDQPPPTMPKAIRQALLLLLAHFYENRSDSAEKAMSSIPVGVNALLGPKSVDLGFA